MTIRLSFIALSNYFVLVTLGFLITACIPLRSTFYRPDLQGVGRITNYQCYQAGGPPNALMFTRDDVQFMVSVLSQEPPVDGKLSTTLQVRVPHNRFVQMSPGEVKVRDGQGRIISLYPVITVFDENAKDSSSKQKRLPLSISKLDGDIFPGNKYDTVYHVWSIIKAPLPKHLVIEIPAMHIGVNEYKAFRVGFREVRGRYLQPINGC